MWKKKVFFVTGYICDKYQLRPSHHINHSQRSQIYIVVLTTTLELGLTTPDQSSPPHPWLAHSTSPVSRPNIAEFVTRIDPAWIFGLMEKILSKKISSFIRRDKWLLYLMDTRILNHKEITRRCCWWNSRHMYSYFFVKLILISRKLKYFIVTCESHLSYPSSTNDFLLSSRMSWKYNCLSFSPMTNIQPKTISRVCVWVSESYPSSSSDHEWFPAREWVGEHKCLCFSHRSFSVGVEDPEREGWRSHINKNKTLFLAQQHFLLRVVRMF